MVASQHGAEGSDGDSVSDTSCKDSDDTSCSLSDTSCTQWGLQSGMGQIAADNNTCGTPGSWLVGGGTNVRGKGVAQLVKANSLS